LNNIDFKNSQTAAKILNNYSTIAIVGVSDKPDRPSYDVAAFLKVNGYKIIPINPRIKEVFGEIAYPDLMSAPPHVDVVDIFRRGEDVGPIVDEAIKKGARAIWMQLGVINEEAARKASQAGLDVVMDMCMKHEFKVLHDR
jgi:uncharacterized protein